MIHRLGACILLVAILISACQKRKPVCQPTGDTPQPKPQLIELIAITPTLGPSPTPEVVLIGGKKVTVDRLITGSFCNDTWRGTIYVGCEAQTAEWNPEEQPLFLAGCNLKIEAGTVVYVAAHNDSAYYNGCSCHTGVEPGQ